MIDFYITITSYKREKMLKNLLSQIKEQKGKYRIKVVVHVDGCKYKLPNWVTVYNYPHHGRERWYLIVRRMFEYMRNEKFKYYLSLQDDIQLCEGFFSCCVCSWEGLPNVVALNLHTDSRAYTPSYGTYSVTTEGNLIYSNWMDMIFMAGDKFKDNLPELYHCNSSISSGVARQLSRHYRRFGKMYHLKKGLVKHIGKSLMNPNYETESGMRK